MQKPIRAPRDPALYAVSLFSIAYLALILVLAAPALAAGLPDGAECKPGGPKCDSNLCGLGEDGKRRCTRQKSDADGKRCWYAAECKSGKCPSNTYCGGARPAPSPSPPPPCSPCTPSPSPPPPPPSSGAGYRLTRSTVMRGSGPEAARDTEVDELRGVYWSVGGTESDDWHVTTGAKPAGRVDIFVAKFRLADDALLCSGRFGSPKDDKAFGADIAQNGDLIVVARTGPMPSATLTGVQRAYNGAPSSGSSGSHTAQHDDGAGWVGVISQDCKTIVRSTYFTANNDWGLGRDGALASNGDIYVASKADSGHAFPPAIQSMFKNRPMGIRDTVLARLSADLNSVQWARYVGGSENEELAASVATIPPRQGFAGGVCFAATTFSADAATTPGAYDRTFGGGTCPVKGDSTHLCSDLYVSCYDDAGNVLWQSFLGGSKNDTQERASIAVDAAGLVYVVMATSSDGLWTSPGAVYPTRGSFAGYLAVFAADGSKLVRATYLQSGSEGIVPTPTGVYLGVHVDQAALTVDSPAKGPIGGPDDAGLLKLSPGLDRILAALRFGSSNDVANPFGASEGCRSLDVTARGDILCSGWTTGTWPLIPAGSSPIGSRGGSTDVPVVHFRAP